MAFHRSRSAGWALVLASSLLLALAARPARAEFDLLGTWYVLVHYQDSATANPDVWRWEDRVWSFESEGSRIRWTEYNIVVFNDESGRFEGRHRVLAAWEPNASQWAEIERGLQTNSRGSKSKSLRARQDGSAWETVGRASVASASIVGYSEDWNVARPAGLPVFTRTDSLGGGEMAEAGGLTRYTTTEVREGGNELSGRFERDGARIGTFRLIRSGARRTLETAAKTPAERAEKQRKAAEQAFIASAAAEGLFAELMGERLSAAGVSLDEAQLADLARQAVSLFQQGLDEQQVAAKLAESAEQRYFAFAPANAVHDDATRYALPFDPSVPRQLVQGANGEFSHKGRGAWAFDFRMPVGTEIRAARAGTVGRVVDGYTRGGLMKSLMGQANTVVIVHADGSFAQYVHLQAGIPVKVGQSVEAGQVIARSGNTGYTKTPHLHFTVWRTDGEGKASSLPIRFDDGSREGFLPAEGLYYGGGG